MRCKVPVPLDVSSCFFHELNYLQKQIATNLKKKEKLMPTYEYACKSCGNHLEVVQSFKDDPLTACTVCGGPLKKVFGSIGISFKGSGFYKNDSRTSSVTSTSSSSSSTSDSTPAAATSATSDSKTEAGTKPDVAKKDTTSKSDSTAKKESSKTSTAS